MLKRYFSLLLLLASLALSGCQTPQGKFTPEQITAMKSYGFNELNGDWSLGLSDKILFDKNDARLRPESESQIQTMASRRLAATGLNHARMDGHTDNYGEEGCQRSAVVKTRKRRGRRLAKANIPRSNLTTRGLGKKYPVASNSTLQGRAEKPPGCGSHQRAIGLPGG